MAIEVKSGFGIDISKQGIDHRFNEGAVKYIQSLISEVLSTQVSQSIEVGWLRIFNRVIVKDSSKFDLAERLKDKLPGFGGNASKAGACIQYEFEIKSGQVNDLSITPANRPDSKDAIASMDAIMKGDLIIRDLGYFVLKYFIEAQNVGAFFISRLNAKIIVYQLKGNVFEELNFGQVYQMMKENHIQRLDKEVYIGRVEKFPVRLIIELMPDEVFNTRMQKVNKFNKKKGYQTSQDYTNRARLNLFICNIPSEIIDGEVIAKIYKIRWQIELIFKIWKSIFGLDNITPMKYERLMCTLNARLLLVLLNWETFMVQRGLLFKRTGKLLSIMKCFNTLKDNSAQLRQIIVKGCKGIKKWVQWAAGIFESNHWLEKKKNKLGFEEILHLTILKSNIYEYIYQRNSETPTKQNLAIY
jgi:hypothetical protein